MIPPPIVDLGFQLRCVTLDVASGCSGRATAWQTLVSERTFVAVRDLVQGTEIEKVELRGVSRPIKIFEIQEQ